MLEISPKSQQIFNSQKHWRQMLYFYMFIISRLISVDVSWRFVFHIVESKTVNYEKLFIVKFHQNLWNDRL